MPCRHSRAPPACILEQTRGSAHPLLQPRPAFEVLRIGALARAPCMLPRLELLKLPAPSSGVLHSRPAPVPRVSPAAPSGRWPSSMCAPAVSSSNLRLRPAPNLTPCSTPRGCFAPARGSLLLRLPTMSVCSSAWPPACCFAPFCVLPTAGSSTSMLQAPAHAPELRRTHLVRPRLGLVHPRVQGLPYASTGRTFSRAHAGAVHFPAALRLHLAGDSVKGS
jgi:hypothetical protein